MNTKVTEQEEPTIKPAEGDALEINPDVNLDAENASTEGLNVEPGDGDDEVVITIGGVTPEEGDDEEATAPKWVKELRKTNREIARENRKLKDKLAAKESGENVVKPLGAKPKLEDFKYDSDEYEVALDKWHEDKQKFDQAKIAKEAEEQTQQQEWQGRLDLYNKAKTELKVKDYEDAEEAVLASLNQTQQGIMVQGADNAANIIYALWKNPGKAAEIYKIKDPVKFAFAVAKLEKDLKVTRRKSPPPPEKRLNGDAPNSGAVDSTLDQLRADAEKTGDYTKVSAHKKKLRNAKA